MAPVGRFTLELADFNRQRSQFSLDHVALADDGSNYAAVKTGIDTLAAAIVVLTLGAKSASLVCGNYERTGDVKATAPEAQINIQWRAYYVDTVTGRRFSVRIPTADLSLAEAVTFNGIDYMQLPLTGVAGAALKGAWDTFVISEDGNPTELETVEYVE